MIPYNPSSFNTNKTILEQILELKNWLKEHPSYRIFEINANFDPLNNEYQLSDVYDEDGIMNTGDVVLFLNSYVASVQSVDRDNGTFLTWDGINIKGPQGSTGPRGPQGLTGATGPQGVSITNATINSSDHLIVTLSNGSTIDAGLVVDGTKAYIIQLTSYAGTLTADDLAIVNDPSKLCVIDYYENSKHSFYFKDRQITGGWRFSNLDYVEGSQITIIQYFEIDSATGSYVQDLTQSFIRAENINSYNATSGKVLQADGNGGASWEDAGGGSVYVHYIKMIRNTASSVYRRLFAYCTIINNDPTPFTTMTSLRTYLISLQPFYLCVSGRMETGNNTSLYEPLGNIACETGTLYLIGLKNDFSGGDTYTDFFSAVQTIDDKVVAL